MRKTLTTRHESYPDTHHDTYSRTTFGFWVFILTDFVLFGTLLASYAVLQKQTFGSFSAKDLFHLPTLFVQAQLLLFCSFFMGLGGAAAHRRKKNATLAFFAIAFLLGSAFFIMQWDLFAEMLQKGAHWKNSAFLSAYFTLIGTHAAHVVFGLLWIFVLLVPVACAKAIDGVDIRRLTCLKMFWQFLNMVWVIIFSFVYLMGVA